MSKPREKKIACKVCLDENTGNKLLFVCASECRDCAGEKGSDCSFRQYKHDGSGYCRHTWKDDTVCCHCFKAKEAALKKFELRVWHLIAVEFRKMHNLGVPKSWLERSPTRY